MNYIQIFVVGAIFLITTISNGMEQSWKLENRKLTPKKRLEIIEQRTQQQTLEIMKLQTQYIQEAEKELAKLQRSLETCQSQLKEAATEVAILRMFIEVSDSINEKTIIEKQKSMNIQQFLDEIVQGMEQAP